MQGSKGRSYLDDGKWNVVHVVDKIQEAIAVANKCSSQQEKEVILI